MTLEYQIFAGLVILVILLIAFACWLSKSIGREQEKLEIADANVKASKDRKQTEKAIKNLSDSELDAKLDKLRGKGK